MQKWFLFAVVMILKKVNKIRETSEELKNRKTYAFFLVFVLLRQQLYFCEGVVGWCEGAVYLTSLGRPSDIGLQLGKACYPCSG